MVTGKLQRSGSNFIVTIPREEVERLGLAEGQLVTVEMRPADVQPVLADDIREAFEASWAQNEAAYRYLAGR